MSETNPRPQTAQRVDLDYAQPVGRARLTLLALGIVSSLIFAIGAGMFAFGMTLRIGDRDAPNFVGIGVTMMVFVVGCVISMYVARR